MDKQSVCCAPFLTLSTRNFLSALIECDTLYILLIGTLLVHRTFKVCRNIPIMLGLVRKTRQRVRGKEYYTNTLSLLPKGSGRQGGTDGKRGKVQGQKEWA